MESRPIKDGFSVVAVRSEESALRHFREESKGVNDVALPQVRRGREYLDFYEQSEIKYPIGILLM